MALGIRIWWCISHIRVIIATVYFSHSTYYTHEFSNLSIHSMGRPLIPLPLPNPVSHSVIHVQYLFELHPPLPLRTGKISLLNQKEK